MRHSIPNVTNHLIVGAIFLLHAAVLFVLPAMHAPVLVWAPVLLAMLWINIIHWGLIHEAIHKLLFASSRKNEWGGRLLGIAMGNSFHVLRYGHLMHHQLNRQFHSEQRLPHTFAGRVSYYWHLLGGVYAEEVVAGWLLTLLSPRRFVALAHATFLRHEPNAVVAGERFFYTRKNISPTSVDVVVTWVLYGAAFYFAGPQGLWLASFVLVRATVISFMDNIYHFGTPADNSKAAKELALPQWLSVVMLHSNYHETHHTNPAVPWCGLPDIHRQQARKFDGGFVQHGLLQFVAPNQGQAAI